MANKLDVAAVTRSLRELADQLENMVSRPSGVPSAALTSAKLENAPAAGGALEAQLEGLAQRIALLENRWERFDNRLGLIAGQLDRQDARNDRRYAILETEVGRLRDNLPAVIENTMREVMSKPPVRS